MELIDNINRLLGDDLKRALKPRARLKVAASCFSMYAFEALKAQLEQVEELHFIFTSPTFMAEEVTDKIRKERKEFHIPKLNRERSLYGSEFEIHLRNKLTQRAIARECADWLRCKAITEMNAHLRVTPLQYTIQRGEQADVTTLDELKSGQAFVLKATETESNRQHSVHSAVKYDLVGKLAEGTQLTRRTVVDILKGLNVAVFAQFKTNPEHFIAEARRLINEQKATMIVEHLAYDPVEERYELDIFTAGQTKQDFSKSGAMLDRHIYDYVLTDSNTEREFVKVLDTASEVVVYAKLPRGFLIPTPVGDYNPDWAIAFKEGVVKHVYFVAETKGSMSSMELRKIEETKIACARKFFDQLNLKYAPENVKYDVVNSFEKLMELVK